MRSNIEPKLIGRLVAVVLIAAPSLAHGKDDSLGSLSASGKVKVETSGTGETIGHIADLKIQNLTDRPLTCAIPPMILESGSGKNQHYACPTGQTVALNPHQTQTVPMNGVCLNRNKPPVAKGVIGDLVMNEANPSGPQNPNSHLPAADADKLLRSCAAKFTAADQLQKSGALKNLPYHDPQKQKDIVVQWSTWSDPQICQIVGTTPATKEDLKKVVYKQIEEQGPMSPAIRKKVDQGIDTIFEKVELTTAKAKDLEKPGPFFEGPISTGKPGPLFQPATVVQPGDVVHVESDDITGAKGHWMVKVKLGNKIVDVWFETDDKPPLKECDWIKINKTSTSARGKTVYVYIKDYEKTSTPTPTEDHEKTTALAPTPTPTATPTTTPTETPTPTPCPEGETHELSTEVKEFTVLDPDGVPIFQCYTNKDSAIAAGNGLSDYFKNGAKIADKMKEHLPPGVGTTVAGWLVGYVKGGHQILDAVLAGRLRTAGVSSVTAAVDLPLKKITATCTTSEICRHGVRVIEKKFSESVERTRGGAPGLPTAQTADSANQANRQWEEVADGSSNYDPAKAETWAKKFLDDHLAALDKQEKDYKDFKDKCR
jgi:hypothetical protein